MPAVVDIVSTYFCTHADMSRGTLQSLVACLHVSRAITAVAAIVVAIVTLIVVKRASVASLFAADVRVRRAAACSNKAFFDSAYTVAAFAASQIAVVAGNFLKSEQVASRVP